MKPSVECRKLGAVLRETANKLPDARLKAEYEYLVRGYLRLAQQFEQDMDAEKLPYRKDRTATG